MGKPSEVSAIGASAGPSSPQQLRESADLLTAIGEAAPDFMWVTDGLSKIQYLNRRWIEYTGLGYEQCQGRGWVKAIHPDDLPAFEAEVARSIRDEGPLEGEWRYRKHDGTYRWFWSRSAPLKDAQGKVVKRVGIAVDVTARRAAEQHAVDTQDRLRQAQRAAKMAPWELNVLTGEAVWSEGIYDFLGLPVDSERPSFELWISMLHPDDRGAVLSHFDEFLRSDREEFYSEFRIIAPRERRVTWLASRGRLTRDRKGEPLRMIGVNIDISDRVALEEQRRVALAEAQASEQRLRFLADSLPDLVWAARPDGYVDYYNKRAYDYLGIPPGQEGGLDWMQFLHPDDAERAGGCWREAIATSQAYECEYRIRRASDRQYRWHVSRGAPMRDADSGDIVRWFGTCVDIHDRKLAQAEIERARAEAEHASKAKDQFLAVLSHELRTPLTPVVMTLAAMEMDRTLTPDMREDIAMIRRNIELETKLIDDLLDVTRIANGKLRLSPRPTDAHALLRNVLDILKLDIADRNMRVHLELNAGDAEVNADAARLQQVFWNLVKNAVKFTLDGGNVWIRTSNRGEGDKLIAIEVADDGAGMDPLVLPKIFDAFDQGDQQITRQFGGLGLGLAITKALTDLHGGTIRAHSDGRGKGARFTVELPTLGAINRLVNQIQSKSDAADGAHRVRVLLVEDHADTQRMLRRLLEERGYHVLTAGSVNAALLQLAREKVDVLVSDIGLPDGSGCDLMRRARQAHALPGVAISGFGMDSDIRASHEAGFTAHLTKPVDVAQLDHLIRGLTRPPIEAVPTAPVVL